MLNVIGDPEVVVGSEGSQEVTPPHNQVPLVSSFWHLFSEGQSISSGA